MEPLEYLKILAECPYKYGGFDKYQAETNSNVSSSEAIGLIKDLIDSGYLNEANNTINSIYPTEKGLKYLNQL